MTPETLKLITPETLGMTMGGFRAIGDVTAGIGGYQAAGYNARIARMQAEVARQVAADEAESALAAGERLVGTQRAVAAASGVDVNAGSPMLAVLDTITASHEEAKRARLRGEYKAWGLESEARLQKWQGKQTLLGGFLGGPMDVLGSVGRSQLLKKAWTAAELQGLESSGSIGIIAR